MFSTRNQLPVINNSERAEVAYRRACSEMSPWVFITLIDACIILSGIFAIMTEVDGDHHHNPSHHLDHGYYYDNQESENDVEERAAAWLMAQFVLYLMSIPFSIWSDCKHSCLVVSSRQELLDMMETTFNDKNHSPVRKMALFARYLKWEADSRLEILPGADYFLSHVEAILPGEQPPAAGNIQGPVSLAAVIPAHIGAANADLNVVKIASSNSPRSLIPGLKQQLSQAPDNSPLEDFIRAMLFAAEAEITRRNQIKSSTTCVNSNRCCRNCQPCNMPSIIFLLRSVASIISGIFAFSCSYSDRHNNSTVDPAGGKLCVSDLTIEVLTLFAGVISILSSLHYSMTGNELGKLEGELHNLHQFNRGLFYFREIYRNQHTRLLYQEL